ncbi:hypothetical protein R3X27_08900 [Tropicimonas sp. TH_r6]|uniref:hypothetical protein n=1 Tax=Tropicimonas sp. TH_r6 TaxID=3082085 RepID=UPI0029547F1D|nr:hypothetical protein [Tropicimonas sp. TH_r6]MDV7142800.1 hypothetical protein [Tropicimonas sp. TH_r6]
MIQQFLKHVALRVALVLTCLGIGLLGWPGDVGAQNFVKVGSEDGSGARRVRVGEAPLPTVAPVSGVLTPGASERAEADGSVVGDPAFAPILAAIRALAAPSRESAEADALRAEFAAPAGERTPYEAAHAAWQAVR